MSDTIRKIISGDNVRNGSIVTGASPVGRTSVLHRDNEQSNISTQTLESKFTKEHQPVEIKGPLTNFGELSVGENTSFEFLLYLY